MPRLTKEQANVFYKSKTWEKCRTAILERDEYLCQVCLRDKDQPVPANTVHHIKHLRDYPELALHEDNLISVCFDCHNKLHPEKGFGKRRKKKARKNIEFVEINRNPVNPW